MQSQTAMHMISVEKNCDMILIIIFILKNACHTSITQLKRSRLSETIILIAIKLAKKVSLTFVSIVKS